MKAMIKRGKYWGLGIGLLPFAITQVLAQTTVGGNASTLDTVQVTGVRSSLQKSQIIKQDFIGTVDAVSAEDVGKFPDQNVADALQRVPGVSVDRSGGESRYITVRGFGPEFNVVTLNGRTMATETAGREFSFDILPSELISAAEVQKTSTADSPEGSIGAMVNIRTQRPLDHPGLHVAASVAGTWDNMSEKTKPKVSALLSHSNADGTLGGLLSVVRYQRHHITEVATTGGWFTDIPILPGVAIPGAVRYEVRDEERTRTGVNGAFDWHPSETLKLGVDAMYSRYEIDATGNWFMSATDLGDILDYTYDENGTATWYRRNNVGKLANDHIIDGNRRDSTNWQLGANLAWDVNDQTTLDVDASMSRAKNDNDPYKNYFIVISRLNFGVYPEWNLNPGHFPAYSNILSSTDTSDLRAHPANRSGEIVSDDIGEFKTSLTRSFYDSALSRLQLGTSASTRTKETYNSVAMENGLGCIYCSQLIGVPAEMVRIFNGGNVAGAGGPTQWLTTVDHNAYFDWLETEEAWGQTRPGGPFYDPNEPDRAQRIANTLAEYGGLHPFPWPLNDWKVREKTWAAFAQADFEGEWGQMPWKLNAGVRYVRTEVTSQANVAEVLSIGIGPADPTFYAMERSEPRPFVKTSRYHDWLPSVNFRLNLRDDLVLRASASETITRPTLTNLRANESIATNTIPLPGTYVTGNVDLKPYTSRNVDLGLEWYMNDTSYIALAGFYKNVRNFITEITVPTTILDHPFMHTMPVNAESSIIKGAEFSFQYTFDRLPSPFDGFGIQANYTWVESQQTFDPALISGQFAVIGLSDSANLVLFYEKERFGVRAAWNWRDEYLETVRGELSQPTSVTPYDQLDVSANFRLNDHISIFADATNITGEKESAWSRYRSRVQRLIDNGRTITLGVRGSW